jgi:hypothetical protein
LGLFFIFYEGKLASMNPKLKKLIPALIAQINDRGGYVTKTKLLKLLYLIDVEYFRVNRTIYTGLSWKFFHLGPWAAEFDPIVNDLVLSGIVLEKQSAKSEYETKFFSTDEHYGFAGLFDSLKEEAPVRNVLNTWSDKSTGEILDFVYFGTEPMEHGIRNTKLDFSTIPEDPIERYQRPSSGIDAKAMRKMKAAFKQQVEEIHSRTVPTHFEFTTPNYDQEFFQAIDALDTTDL